MHCRSRYNLSILLFSSRHCLDFFAQRTPVFGLQLGILHPLLAPVLMQPADVILAHLEIQQLVTDTFLDKHAPRMLLDDRLFVLQRKKSPCYSCGHVERINGLIFSFLFYSQGQIVVGREWGVGRKTRLLTGHFFLTLIIESSTFSTSPGLTTPSGLARNSFNFLSLLSILRSSCGMLSLA